MNLRPARVNYIWTIAAIGVGIYVLLAMVLYLAQPRLVFFPSRELATLPTPYGLEYEDIQLRTQDGVELHGWFLPAPTALATLLFFHGNAGNISHRLESIQLFHDIGLDVMIIDYRGYGQSTGHASEQGTYLDADAAWTYLVEQRGVDPMQIIVFGRSLGAAVASWIAIKHQPAALILESTFTSIPDIAAHYYPLLPVRWLARIRYDNRSRLAKVQCPVLVIHSKDDEIIPYAHAKQLFEMATSPKQLLEIAGDHNRGFLMSRLQYSQGIRAFITGALETPRSNTSSGDSDSPSPGDQVSPTPVTFSD